jgi:hypothetical protein
MIESNIELRVTVQRLLEFKTALKGLRSNTQMDPLEIEIRAGFIESQIEIFEDDIREYLYRGL